MTELSDSRFGRILDINAWGSNRIDATREFFRCFAVYDGIFELKDVRQIRVEDMCCFYFKLYIKKDCSVLELLKSILLTGSIINFEVDYKLVVDDGQSSPETTLPASLLDATDLPYTSFSSASQGDIFVAQIIQQSNLLDPGFLASLLEIFYQHGVTIHSAYQESIQIGSTENNYCQSFGLKVSFPPNLMLPDSSSMWEAPFVKELYSKLQNMCWENHAEIVMRRDDMGYKAKNQALVVVGMNETLIKQEVIDEMLVAVGKDPKSLENSAMSTHEILRNKFHLLAGYPESLLIDVLKRLTLTKGACLVCSSLKAVGYKLALFTQGFDLPAKLLGGLLGFDYTLSNHMEILDGKITGRLVEEKVGVDAAHMMDPSRKVDWLQLLCEKEQISKENVIVVGDYKHADFLYESCGYRIFFNAALHIDLRISLYMMGFKRRDVLQFETRFKRSALSRLEGVSLDQLLPLQHWSSGSLSMHNVFRSYIDHNLHWMDVNRQKKNSDLVSSSSALSSEMKKNESVELAKAEDIEASLSSNAGLDYDTHTVKQALEAERGVLREVNGSTEEKSIVSPLPHDYIEAFNENVVLEDNRGDLEDDAHQKIIRETRKFMKKSNPINMFKAVVYMYGEAKPSALLRVIQSVSGSDSSSPRLRGFYHVTMQNHFILVAMIIWKGKPEDSGNFDSSNEKLHETEEKKYAQLKNLVFEGNLLGLKIKFDVSKIRDDEEVRDDAQIYDERGARYVLVLLKQPSISAQLLDDVFQLLLTHNVKIEHILRLSDSNANALQIRLFIPKKSDAEDLKSKLLICISRYAADMALQRDDIMRYCRRLVVFDMDSTLIQQEVIDEVASVFGVSEKVSNITRLAMTGQMEFLESLKSRTALLKGASSAMFEQVLKTIELTPGAMKLCSILRHLGYRLAVVSGGFAYFANHVKNSLGLHHAFANNLEYDKSTGLLTGKLLGPVVTPQRKASLLRMLADVYGCTVGQVVAIGDGANDIPMLLQAGMGVAFCAKPKVQETAAFRLNTRDLLNLIYLLGIPEQIVARYSLFEDAAAEGGLVGGLGVLKSAAGACL